MEIKFLGTGGAFNFSKGNASAMVTIEGKKILIDCGFSTILALAQKDLIKEIDHILITHLHGDHVGSMPTLLAYIVHKLDKPAPSIIVPTESFRQEIHNLLTATYEDKRAEYISIDEFPFIGAIDTTDQHVPGMTSYAYYFTENDSLIYFSGDIGNTKTAKDFLDSRSEKNIKVFHETTPKKDVGAHASYIEIQEQLRNYDTYVYHIDKGEMPDDCLLKYVEDYPEFLA